MVSNFGRRDIYSIEGGSSLAPQALSYMRIVTFLSSLMAGISVGVTAWLFLDGVTKAVVTWVAVILVAVVAVADILIFNPMEYRRTRYSATAEYFLMVRGRYFRRDVFMPTASIISIQTVQGPILRSLGIFKLKLVHITGEVAVGPLTETNVERLRAALMASHENIRTDGGSLP